MWITVGSSLAARIDSTRRDWARRPAGSTNSTPTPSPRSSGTHSPFSTPLVNTVSVVQPRSRASFRICRSRGMNEPPC